tara:strand:+ start:63 stop:389 length:327 start_codon:yes stop_codon:yes gene_type:complete
MSEQQIQPVWVAEGIETDEGKEKRRKYMREWKRKKYAENPDAIKNCNKTAYYKNKYNGTKTDILKYGEMFPLVSKITSNLEELREENVELFRDLIRKYSFEVLVKDPL